MRQNQKGKYGSGTQTADMKTISMNDRKRLEQAAIQARQFAYVPYSHFAVGAALLCADGEIISGVNVENASYPAGICAERTAIAKAVSEGKRDFLALAIAGGPENGQELKRCSPCGICRQVLREFAGPDFEILYSDGRGGFAGSTLAQLLPDSFGPEALS